MIVKTFEVEYRLFKRIRKTTFSTLEEAKREVENMIKENKRLSESGSEPLYNDVKIYSIITEKTEVKE